MQYTAVITQGTKVYVGSWNEDHVQMFTVKEWILEKIQIDLGYNYNFEKLNLLAIKKFWEHHNIIVRIFRDGWEHEEDGPVRVPEMQDITMTEISNA